MLLIYKENEPLPYALKVNADEYFRALKKCQGSGETEMEFNSNEHAAIVDLLEDPVTYNNMERTVLITPSCSVLQWLE